jgi:hypothetical protein
MNMTSKGESPRERQAHAKPRPRQAHAQTKKQKQKTFKISSEVMPFLTTRCLLPQVRLKAPCGQKPHLLIPWKLMTLQRERDEETKTSGCPR